MPAAYSLEEDIEYSLPEQVEHRANNSTTWKIFLEKAVYGPKLQQ